MPEFQCPKCGPSQATPEPGESATASCPRCGYGEVRSIPLLSAVRIASEIALALADSHAQGVTHGALRPQNVRMDQDGHAQLTQGPATRETSAYASPEQVDDPGSAEPPADLYALGLMLFQMIVGRLPRESESIEEALAAGPPSLAALVRGLLLPDPEKRSGPADLVAASLEEIVAELSGEGAPEPAQPKKGKKKQSNQPAKRGSHPKGAAVDPKCTDLHAKWQFRHPAQEARPRHRLRVGPFVAGVVLTLIAGLSVYGSVKYLAFQEHCRRKACLGQLRTLENAMAVWETCNSLFADNARFAFAFTPRTGRICQRGGDVPSPRDHTDASAAILDSGKTLESLPGSELSSSGPREFVNFKGSGPLAPVIRDDLIWICPSALSGPYRGELSSVPDDYADEDGPGGSTNPLGLQGRYCFVVAGMQVESNEGYPADWVTPGRQANRPPSTQAPFKMAICGCYGTYGPTRGTAPGTNAVSGGGPVGPKGTPLDRHSDRW